MLPKFQLQSDTEREIKKHRSPKFFTGRCKYRYDSSVMDSWIHISVVTTKNTSEIISDYVAIKLARNVTNSLIQPLSVIKHERCPINGAVDLRCNLSFGILHCCGISRIILCVTHPAFTLLYFCCCTQKYSCRICLTSDDTSRPWNFSAKSRMNGADLETPRPHIHHEETWIRLWYFRFEDRLNGTGHRCHVGHRKVWTVRKYVDTTKYEQLSIQTAITEYTRVLFQSTKSVN